MTPWTVGLPGFPVRGISQARILEWVAFPIRLLSPWDFPGKNTGVGCHFPLQGIFLTQGLNPCLLHWQADSLPLSYLGNTSYPITVHKLTLTFKGHRSPQQHKHREAGGRGAHLGLPWGQNIQDWCPQGSWILVILMYLDFHSFFLITISENDHFAGI